MPKVESTACEKDGCTLYYENKGRLLCVECAGRSSQKQEAKKKAARLEAKKKAARLESKMPDIAYENGYDCEIGVNPYSYGGELRLYCAWQAGFNDARDKREALR